GRLIGKDRRPQRTLRPMIPKLRVEIEKSVVVVTDIGITRLVNIIVNGPQLTKHITRRRSKLGIMRSTLSSVSTVINQRIKRLAFDNGIVVASATGKLEVVIYFVNEFLLSDNFIHLIIIPCVGNLCHRIDDVAEFLKIRVTSLRRAHRSKRRSV